MKLLLSVAFLFLAMGEGRASNESAGAHFGVQGGMNFANTTNNTSEGFTAGDTNRITGLSAGVALESPLMPGLVYLQPELNFVQKGSEVPFGGTLGRVSEKLSYFEVPLNLKVKAEIGSVKPFLMAGPKVGYLVGTSASSSNGVVMSSSTDPYNKIDFGLNFGAGAGFNLGNFTELMLTARYGLGLTNITKTPNLTTKNNTFEILAGLLF